MCNEDGNITGGGAGEGVKITDEEKRFFLIRDAAHFDREEAERLVAAYPDIIHARNGIDETALHFLAVENDLPAVEWLRQKGAAIDSVNRFSETPLLDAASLGYLGMCQYLVEHGANPRHMTVRKGGVNSAFSKAAYHEHIEVLHYLMSLIRADEDINQYLGNVEAEMILKYKPGIAEILVGRGLRRRWGMMMR